MTVKTDITSRVRTLRLPNGQLVKLKHGQTIRDFMRRK